MENKENVLVQNEGTEQAATAGKSADFGAEEMGSAVFKKFKDVNALARAYGALEAEFTRRSQRLKELERKIEEGQKVESGLAGEVGNDGGCREAEKLTAEGPKESGAEDLEKVVQPSEEAGDGEVLVGIERNSVTRNTVEDHGCGQGYGESAFSDGEKLNDTVVATSVGNVGSELSDDEIYRIANNNESVRIKIVGEYLASLKKAGVPLVRGGVGTVATPPSRARSVTEAGDMALRFFQTGK